MRELKKEEWLKSAFDFLIIESSGKMHPSAKQAYQQIKALIREDNVKRDMIIDNRLGIKKKEVTEEWIEEKVMEKLKNMKEVPRGRAEKGEPYFDIISFDVGRLVRFVRSFIEEIHGRSKD